ncbi:tribbles homolog 3 [Latimeria chalumnae]|uniref:Tribbles pseudokinase 3 n=1 Tax=Latimeria chalumnae TaxID=7897 RepID=H3AA74_LATCH|nr:PREDICTED: tribbles homolog 2 [Latimeria chalumnae]|eukprot:XP_006010599.1 PREDICTED: tribbles homolog 2 [Latimeria chalumnae]
MSINVQQTLPNISLRKKPLEFDDGADSESPKSKCPRLSQPLSPGLAPCLRLLPETPSSSGDKSGVSRIGPYILLEALEGRNTHRVVHSITEEEYTCKVFSMKCYQEVLARYSLLPPHPHIAQIVEVILGDQHAYVFFEHSHRDMHLHVRACKRLPEEEAASLFRQMAEALAHCHTSGVILRDLKLRKFVFTNKERTHLVLENLEDSCILAGEDDSLSDKHGCPAYVGPEILNSKTSYSGKAADVWSLGVVLYTMLVGRYPFQDAEPTGLFSKIRRGVFTVPDSLSPRAKCLIRSILRKNPSERLTASEILLHPWLTRRSHVCANSAFGPLDRRTLDQLVPDIDTFEDSEYFYR